MMSPGPRPPVYRTRQSSQLNLWIDRDHLDGHIYALKFPILKILRKRFQVPVCPVYWGPPLLSFCTQFYRKANLDFDV